MTLDGIPADIPDAAVAELDRALRGGAFGEGSAEYDQARTIWNAMSLRKPGLALRALGARDVQKAVNFARENNLLLAIRSGGHQIAGHAVAEGGLLLDLSQMRSVQVDPAARTARAEPDATLGDLDTETQAHGLALGGGFGWITRKFGMTADNLLSAQMVTADGAIVTASPAQNGDLFCAIRGGGNFGVVTSFEFQLYPVGPEVLSGLIVHPLAEGRALLPEFARIADAAEDALTVWSVLGKAPPLPFLPVEWHGKEALIFAACYAGGMQEGEAALAELRGLGNPIADVIGPHPFTTLAGGL